MKKALTFVAFGAGYVLGSRAGRQRYEQLVAAAKRASTKLEAYAQPSDEHLGMNDFRSNYHFNEGDIVGSKSR